uniref:F-box protein AT5G49610-like beta-propeller domain-containing protein n=1 Tax=Setaria italica TaxID=4555 RepID=K3YTD5_SETIT
MGRTERKRSGPAAAVPAAVASVLGNDVLLAEILLRLDLPTWLVRAALVSRRWFRGASDPAFLRHFRALHPPRVLALHANAVGFGRGETRCLPVPQPPGLAAAAPSRRCAARNSATAATAACCLLNNGRDEPIPQPPRSNPGSLLRDKRGTCEGSLLRLLENDADSTSCLFLNLRYNDEELAAEFSLLQSGVWGVARSTVTELPQRIFDTMVAHKLLVGRKFYMTTALGYILGLDLVTASFFTVQLPADIWNSTSFRLSRPQQSGLYLIDAKGFQLQVCRGDGMGQWALVDTISVPKVCGHLNVRRWVPDDAQTAPVSVLAAGENAEFVFLELVASGIVCCIQLSNRAVERVGVGLRMTEDFIRPLTMVWPPVFPVLN